MWVCSSGRRGGAPGALLANAFWWPVALGVVAGVAGALGGRRAAVVAVAEAMLVAVLLHAFGRPEARRAFDVERGTGSPGPSASSAPGSGS